MPSDGSASDHVESDHVESHHVESHHVDQSPEEILAYWTPERMASAKPREVVLPDPAERDDTPDPEGDAD